MAPAALQATETRSPRPAGAGPSCARRAPRTSSGVTPRPRRAARPHVLALEVRRAVFDLAGGLGERPGRVGPRELDGVRSAAPGPRRALFLALAPRRPPRARAPPRSVDLA